MQAISPAVQSAPFCVTQSGGHTSIWSKNRSRVFTIFCALCGLIRYITFLLLDLQERQTGNLLPFLPSNSRSAGQASKVSVLIKSNPVEPCRPVPYESLPLRVSRFIAALFTSLHKPPHWYKYMSSPCPPPQHPLPSQNILQTWWEQQMLPIQQSKLLQKCTNVRGQVCRFPTPHSAEVLQGSRAWTFS